MQVAEVYDIQIDLNSFSFRGMSNLHKSKQSELIDMFNDISRYLDDIYSPSINLDLRNIFRGRLHLVLSKREVPRDIRNSRVRRQDKFRRDWSRH